MKRTRALLAAAIAGSLSLLGTGVSWAQTTSGPDVTYVAPGPGASYVNMGDSYSADAGQLPIVVGSFPQCARSSLNWGQDLAKDYDFRLTDVSCSGAHTFDFSTSQFSGTVPPQLTALSSATQLVTMTLGFNDSNVFIDMVGTCGPAALRTLGKGSPCKDANGDRFVRTIETSTYPNLVAALSKVRTRAPNAIVAISGYLQILPRGGGCFPALFVASGDVPYVNGVEDAMNDAVRRAALATGAVYVDESSISAGHDACQPSGARWVEPVLGGVAYVPLHPNAAGERAMEIQTAGVLGLGYRSSTARTGVVGRLLSAIR